MRICVVGTGYVGLVAGAGLSEFGNTVTCTDIDGDKIDMLNDGELPIYEPGLKRLVLKNAEAERLKFSTDIESAASSAEIVFLAVGTPMGDDGRADLSQLFGAARMVAKGLSGYTVIVNKSTVPVGTAEAVQKEIDKLTDEEFTVASNPEFLKEGDAVNDFMKPDRIIIGTTDERAADLLHYLYSPFVRTRDRIMLMDARSAELTKYASNSYLATRVSFINEISRLCDAVGADVEQVRLGMGSDRRIGPKFLFPGIGYGGSCFPKDVSALLHISRDAGYDLQIVKATSAVNEKQKSILVSKVLDHFSGDISGRTFAVWGLSFKPKTDDVREAPSLVVVRDLLEAGAKVSAFDPVAGETFAEAFGTHENLQIVDSPYKAADNASGVLLCTEWPELRRPDFQMVGELIAEKVVFDGRNIWEPTYLAELGFTCYSIGRPTRS
jgi:UDPglucose 6-dehydrogenase